MNYKKLKKLMKRQRRELRDKAMVPQNWEMFSRELKAEIDKFGVFFNDTWGKLKVKVDVLCQSLTSTPAVSTKDQKRRKSSIELYLELSELKKFIFLNAEGARKLVKKFDKLNGTKYLEGFIESSELIQDMVAEQRSIDASLDRLLSSFADAFTDGDQEAASGLLSKSLTDLVEWEKGTIWNDLLRLERSKTRIGTRATMARVNHMKKHDEGAPELVPTTEEHQQAADTEKPVTTFQALCYSLRNPLVLANLVVLISSGMAYYEQIPGLTFHSSRCLAVLLLVSGWWSLGTFPLFVSALAVPLLVVVCDVLPLPSRGDAAKLVLSHMWGGSQAMVLASFALAAALSKLRLDKKLACVIISLIKNGRRKIMFAFMTIGWSTSFAIGNMASSVLCLSLAAPVLDELPQLDAATADYGRRLLIAIAFSCNFGGMTSPIASPQNIVAFAALQPFGTSFAQWVFVAVPTSFVLLLITFWYLMPKPRPKFPTRTATGGSIRLPLLTTSLATDSEAPGVGGDSFDVETELPPRLTDGMRRKFEWDWRRQAVVGLLFFAAALWMASSLTVSEFGDVGLASLLPLLLLFALPGVLNKSDFLSMPWDVCLLLASGGVLSAAVSQSQLLSIAGQSASSILATLTPLMCLIVCCVFVTVVSTGVSHTAAANVLMPFIVELGKSAFGPENAVRFILPVSLCLSAGMALPVSSCPNMNATAIARGSDESVAWVKPTDYLKPGLILSVVTVVVFVVIADPLTAIFCSTM